MNRGGQSDGSDDSDDADDSDDIRVDVHHRVSDAAAGLQARASVCVQSIRVDGCRDACVDGWTRMPVWTSAAASHAWLGR